MAPGPSGPVPREEEETIGPEAKRKGGVDLSDAGGLMARAQAGDRAAYDALLRLCEDWIGMYLGRRLAPDRVDDVRQEILLAVHAKRHTYDPRRPFGPWLAGIARFKLMDRLRQHYKVKEDELEDQGQTPSHERAVLSGVVVSRLLEGVSPAQAAAIRLVKLEGHSVAHAAEATGQSQSLVKVNIHRGLKKMLRAMEADDV